MIRVFFLILQQYSAIYALHFALHILPVPEKMHALSLRHHIKHNWNMSAILVGPITMKMFGYCVIQSQYARVLPVYHAAMFVMTRTRTPVNVRKFSRRVQAPKYVHLYTLLKKWPIGLVQTIQ